MTQLKKLKKAIRSRAGKTGESYTAARRQVLLARQKRAASAAPSSPAARATAEPPKRGASRSRPAGRPGARSGISDASVVKKTGHGFDHWFAVLDAFGTPAKGHTAAATHLYEAHGVPGWHAQMITVAYERERGLRATNQACTGTFQVSVSKTVPASVAEVAAALRDARRRAEWLRSADPGLARAVTAAFAGPKPRQVMVKDASYARLRFPWDGATVEIRVYGKPKGASVVADNKDLPDAGTVERRRAQWRAALEGLNTYLGR